MPTFNHSTKILSLFILGYLLVSHYRPYHTKKEFNNLGLADSGPGLVSLLIVYLFFNKPAKSQSPSLKSALLILTIYLSQELFCLLVPGIIGAFDYKDLIFYIIGFFLIYLLDIRKKALVS